MVQVVSLGSTRRWLALAALGAGVAFAPTVPAQVAPSSARSAPRAQETGSLAGVVRDLRGIPIARATVAVTGLDRTVESDTQGRFELDGVPIGERAVRVVRSGFEPLGFTIRFPEPGRLEVALELRAVAPEPMAPPSMTPQLLVGQVVDDAGNPVPEAEIGIMGTPTMVTADSTGRFRLADLAPGPYLLSVRRLGFAPRTISRTIGPSPMPPLVVQLERQLVALAPTTVTAAKGRENHHLAGFYQRKANASGVFFEQEDIERRRPAQFTDLFRANTTLTVQRDRTGRQYVETRLVGTGRCLPAVFIDGAYYRQEPGLLDAMAPPDQVRAVEVYNGRASVPGAFSRPGTDCGVIAVWTK